MSTSIISRPAGGLSAAAAAASSLLALLAFSALPQRALANANAPCYDPTGIVAPGYYPCDPNAYITNCCAAGWTCFSNSLCVVTAESNAYPNLTLGAVARAMCTNPNWNNDICGDFCVTGAGNADGDMVACGDDHFCCLGDYNAGLCNCTLSPSSDAGDSFVVNDGKAQTVIGETASFTGTVSYLTSQPTPSPTSAAASAKSSATNAANSTSGGTATGTGTSTGTATSTGTGTGTSTPPPKSTKHAMAIGLGVGLGVGIPLLAIVAGAVYWFTHHHSGGGHAGIGGRRSLPTELALDGTAFGEQMALQGNEYRRGGGGIGGGLAGQRIDLNDLGEVPPPPPQVRRDVA